jgi:hypothetical protein
MNRSPSPTLSFSETVASEDSAGSDTTSSLQNIADIVQAWREGSMTVSQYKTLQGMDFNEMEFIAISERFGLKHGAELLDFTIVLTECPSSVHEIMSRKMDLWIYKTFGEELIVAGSTSILSL